MQIIDLTAESYAMPAGAEKSFRRSKKVYETERKRSVAGSGILTKKRIKNGLSMSVFAWTDSFRTLPIRFDKLDKSWLNWHFIAFTLILLKV